MRKECITCDSREKSIFCHLENEALVQIDQQKNTNTYKKGQDLFLEGNPPFGLYCVNSGKIKIYKVGEDGKETIIRIASSGELLGHRSLFTNKPYNASATVIEEAQVCFLSKTTINELIQKNPSLSFEIINRLSVQMGAAENRLVSLSQKNLRERFAELLLLLKESHGIPHPTGTKLDIRLTREEMASMIGSATENLIRLITEFKKDSLIEQEGKYLIITNSDKIEEIAHV